MLYLYPQLSAFVCRKGYLAVGTKNTGNQIFGVPLQSRGLPNEVFPERHTLLAVLPTIMAMLDKSKNKRCF
jgi:hypothetical protein